MISGQLVKSGLHAGKPVKDAQGMDQLTYNAPITKFAWLLVQWYGVLSASSAHGSHAELSHVHGCRVVVQAAFLVLIVYQSVGTRLPSVVEAVMAAAAYPCMALPRAQARVAYGLADCVQAGMWHCW